MKRKLEELNQAKRRIELPSCPLQRGAAEDHGNCPIQL